MSRFQKIKIKELQKAQYNPRRISKENLSRLTKSIKNHTKYLTGWSAKDGYRLVTSVTINSQGSRVVGGHQRLDALEKLGQDWIHEADISWVDMEPNSNAEKALNVALNNPNLTGEFDEELLKNILIDMDNDDKFDITSTGFGDLDLNQIFKDSEASSKDKTEDGRKIMNDCTNGLLISVGFCDLLVAPGTHAFDVLYENFGKKYNYSDDIKEKVLGAIVNVF